MKVDLSQWLEKALFESIDQIQGITWGYHVALPDRPKWLLKMKKMYDTWNPLVLPC
jgi:hypothetical protein